MTVSMVLGLVILLTSIELIDRITQDLDKSKIPISIFLDLSKAFDTLDHVILLQKLNYYGIKSVELKLFQDYLLNRTQYVSYDKTNSDMYRISTGVPQGAILGPLLFIIYINNLCNASEPFKMIIYADDTTLYSTLDVFGNYISKNLNLELSKVADWLNKLSINIKKFKFMVFHMPQKQVNIPNIEIEKIKIEFADKFNFLGLTIHKHLKWDSHINKIASKILNIIGIMYRLKHMVPSEIVLTIYNGLIKPHILYGLKCWGFNQEIIFKLQKKAMRIICSSGFLAHSEPLFN